MKGLVIKNTGSWYIVRTEAGEVVNCKIKGNFRLKGFRCTNPVAVGDIVTIEIKPDGTAFIVKIEPRSNYIIRRASNLSKEFQILAANLSQAVLVVTLTNPETNTTFVDRFLATAEAYRVPVVMAINKIDLLTAEEDKELLDAFAYLYESIGYPVIKMSTLTGEGIDQLKAQLKDKTTLFSGNSGVGKSSLINMLVPDANLKVGDVSETHHTGMHTTTFSEMIELPEGGYLIDTPGIKGFGTFDIEKEELTSYFKEIFHFSKDCRFSNCTHTHEPGCAVIKAVEDHFIAASRYQSYLSMLEDKDENKYRESF